MLNNMTLSLSIMLGLLFLLCFSSTYLLLLAWPRRRPRWTKLRHNKRAKRGLLMKLLRLHALSPEVVLYSQLLASSGLRLNAMSYLMMKRSALIIGALASITLLTKQQIVTSSVLIASLALLLLDKPFFQMLSQRRKKRIMHEVYVLSRQLLYYSGSKMNLHSKLKRCLPFTTVLRQDLDLLIRQWYDGAEQAISQFKMRLGTDEAYSFAETLNALRLHDDARYYDLLQQRMSDYKEKIELDNESKKETHSYVLFILAGLPIMNTFRVFIYPWVQEGQRLFESLN